MGVEDTIKEIAGELEKIATTKTVVGDPITAAGKTIIPVSKLTMGFGAGGGEGKKDNESGYGGGGGAGAKIEPVAFIMLSEDEAKIFRISEKNDVGSLLSSLQEVVPEILDKFKGMTGKHKKEESPEVGKTEVKEHMEPEEKEGSSQ
ncbi:sporulation protein [Methanosarcina sp. 1.H.T.1A.1]|uniref:GerW family sporulation protein n=1 Tax=unclassified Methanosarcina TaxID=2644672 RepID=UPI000622B44F|nr:MULTISPECIES: GerW family sporulation protein [unclassified Methanosarcina]KKH46481.1 sporulation protein [Methanosarcina sp. 1.H.A.2.2]KKH97929.1 sporulation protein [Methanosarcina sp. 1.H.T.1A.1]